ncbi:endo-1,4-beta-xylanase [Apibacter sp. HY039]|uniref:endo-1,4-beta-xylanase n=1 Tax=Apibacter sp. HY039 TaxID=2501476 RepID=UPI000FEBED4C|nr:endo-1,4-beta-xylanase [Apibacter sp. HY039]
MKKILFFFLLSITILTSCRSDGSEDTVIPPTVKEFTLKEAPFPIGFTVNSTLLNQDSKFRKILIEEASTLTPEYGMKMRTLLPSKDKYYWKEADDFVEFATNHNKRIHGHTLIWHTSTPDWVNNFTGDRNAWIELMKNYIHTVVGRYKGKITSWDVVNEAFLEDGSYRPTIWYQKIGPEYIEFAFRFAHEADPNALLFYNDFGTDYLYKKSIAIGKMIELLQSKKIAIHGIGLQMHTRIKLNEDYLTKAFTYFTKYNILIHISELDIRLGTNANPVHEFSEELAMEQKKQYKMIAKIFKDLVPEKLQYGITIWGVSDAHSWLTQLPEWPLLYDKDYQKKPAYYGLQEVFEKK